MGSDIVVKTLSLLGSFMVGSVILLLLSIFFKTLNEKSVFGLGYIFSRNWRTLLYRNVLDYQDKHLLAQSAVKIPIKGSNHFTEHS